MDIVDFGWGLVVAINGFVMKIKIKPWGWVLLAGLVSVVPLIVFLSEESARVECRQSNDGMETMHRQRLILSNGAGKTAEIEVHVADDDRERASGYQHICRQVVHTTAILFVYEKPVFAQFHMNNVKVPLDIGFFNDNGVLIQWMKMNTYTGAEKPLYGPKQPFRFALETEAGFFEKNNLTAGNSKIELDSL